MLPAVPSLGMPADDLHDDAAALGLAQKDKGGPSDFVKKLFKMLEDPSFADVVCWGYTGESFVVKDMSVFTQTILPLHFKHSNFASFVRQLNKYDFHKVKHLPEEGCPYGEHAWEFRHPSFAADMKCSLDNIKRKPPTAARKPSAARPSALADPPSPHSPSYSADLSSVHAQLDNLTRSYGSMSQHVQNLTADYQGVLNEMSGWQRAVVRQDEVLRGLIETIVDLERTQHASAPASSSNLHAYAPSQRTHALISSYHDLARTVYDELTDFGRRRGSIPARTAASSSPAAAHAASAHGGDGLPSNFGQLNFNPYPAHTPQPNDGGHGHRQHVNGGPNGIDGHGIDDNNSKGKIRGRAVVEQQQAPPSSQQTGAIVAPQPVPIPIHLAPLPQQQHASDEPREPAAGPSIPRRLASKPDGWAVAPKVLLVEDDAVCRKLSSKFLQVFGCDIEVATDGLNAVNKMNVEKYDLVLMDIVMPVMDGVSATTMIRQFDPMTPIISMTANSNPDEVVTYFAHGMNDILAKPFTRSDLLNMLQKHLNHLMLVHRMAEIPRALGYTDSEIQNALVASHSHHEGGAVTNPFSAIGLSDGDYMDMLRGYVIDPSIKLEGKAPIKRRLESVVTTDADAKRPRFSELGPMDHMDAE